MSMGLILMELRKIWRPLPFAGIALVCAFAALFMIGSSPLLVHGGASAGDNDPVAESTVYGLTVETAKPELERQYRELVPKADAQIAAVPAAKAKGITDMAGFQRWNAQFPQTPSDDDAALLDTLTGLPSVQAVSRISALLESTGDSPEDFASQIRSRAASYLGFGDVPRSPLPPLAERRVERIAAAYGSRTMLDLNIESTITDSAPIVFAAIGMSVIILIAPMLTRDQQLRIRQLQWASKTGRNALGAQAIAMGVSCAALSLAIAGLWAAWTANALRPCLGISLISYNPPLIWFDWTVGQYLAAEALTAALGGTASGLLAGWIIRARPNMIRMLIAAIPVAVAIGIVLARVIGRQPFTFANPMAKFITIPGVEPVALLAVLLLASVLWAVSVRRLGGKELLE